MSDAGLDAAGVSMETSTASGLGVSMATSTNPGSDLAQADGSMMPASGSADSSPTKEELMQRVVQLEAHVRQLQNIVANTGLKPAGKAGQKPFDFTRYNTRHVALRFLYLGWDYHGYACQEDTNKTIEADLFEALLRTKLIEARQGSHYHRCGRTDKGVSAFSQVISLDLRTSLLDGPGVKVREGGTAHLRTGDHSTEIPYINILNKVLPPHIRMLAWCPVDPEFSARFSCIQRTYKYFFPRAQLDITVMREAAAHLVGLHDFRNLCKMDVGNGVTNFTRRILATDIQQLTPGPESGYEMWELTITGQAFLWHQIRCIIAVLFLIGQHKESPQVIQELLDVQSNPRKPQYSMASELPLVLFDCDYADADWIYSTEWLGETVRNMQEHWTTHTVRSVMVRQMLTHMEHKLQESAPTKADMDGAGGLADGVAHAADGVCSQVADSECSQVADGVCSQLDSLMPGRQPRIYKPLMQREKCESLETRLHQLNKRRRVEPPEDAPS